MDTLIIFSAKYLIYIIAVVAVAIVVWYPEHRIKIFWVAVIALPLGYALARLLGVFYSHHQPFAEQGFEPLIAHAVDNSFPSDHTLISGIFASLAFLADRRVGVALWVLALAVGVARVAAGVHWPVDIAASVVLAVLAVAVATGVVSSIRARRRQSTQV